MKATINFTGDNENMAMEEIQETLEDAGFEVKKIRLANAKRACRNAYGKEMDEEEFDDLDANSEEVWFDDYDFSFKVEIYSDEMSDEEIEEFLAENFEGFESDMD